jgi:(1->4)-alpha-D-glucan 1-alpha-D-glucosylmutase
VGAWPHGLAADDEDGVERFATRIAAWQRKALREAKRWTRWTSPNEPYEDACGDFLRAMLSGEAAAELAAFAAYIAVPGAANGLAQTVLRLTTPGVPDLYQGTDYWDFSLVDPDNRRPVDFLARADSLERDLPPVELIPNWRDGSIKQAVIARLLGARRAHPDLFARGGYRPLLADGPEAGHVLAFAREHRGQRLVVAVARHTAAWLAGTAAPAIPADCWARTSVTLPAGRWMSIFGGERLEGGTVEAAALFGELPVAAWISAK